MKRDDKRKGYCGTIFVSQDRQGRFYSSRLFPAVQFPFGDVRLLYRINLYKRGKL